MSNPWKMMHYGIMHLGIRHGGLPKIPPFSGHFIKFDPQCAAFDVCSFVMYFKKT